MKAVGHKKDRVTALEEKAKAAATHGDRGVGSVPAAAAAPAAAKAPANAAAAAVAGQKRRK